MFPLAAAGARLLGKELLKGAGQELAGHGFDALKNALQGNKAEGLQANTAQSHQMKSPVTF